MTVGSGLMVCGTGSDSGKSTVVTGLCRLLARRGMRVAPFKGQNMALNSAVTADGFEIGRAQAAQASAAGVAAEVAMNPVLLKPTGPRTSQVVVLGRPWETLDASTYQDAKEQLWPVVTDALEGLRRRFDMVICEGAGSPAEINLLRHDLVNLRLARHAGIPAVLVGDIDRGGVFAALFGTVTILPPGLSAVLKAFVINKFRGDQSILSAGIEELGRLTGRPTLGVLPWLGGLDIDAEDSLALERRTPPDRGVGDRIEVAVVRLPRISNFTDFDALALEPGVTVRYVHSAAELGRPDLVVLPGTKSTVADLEWLRVTGLDHAVTTAARSGSVLLGVCGGYQMLGRRIEDPFGVEASPGTVVAGLGLVESTTVFVSEKVTRTVEGRALGQPVGGYEIHHGRTTSACPWIDLDGEGEGCASPDGSVLGTSVHGLLESDGFRRAFLADVAYRAGRAWDPGPPVSFAAARDQQFDRIADAVEEHLDVGALLDIALQGSHP